MGFSCVCKDVRLGPAIQVKPGDWRMAMIDPPATAPVEVAHVERPEDVREWNAMDYTQMLSRLVY